MKNESIKYHIFQAKSIASEERKHGMVAKSRDHFRLEAELESRVLWKLTVGGRSVRKRG